MEQSETEVMTPRVDTEPDQTAKLATPPPEDETAASVIPLPHQDIVSLFYFILFWFTYNLQLMIVCLFL